jgi:hypothetical protein
MRQVFKFGQKWPGDVADNEYWIAIDINASRVQHGDGQIIERECRSLAEIEAIVAHIRADLDRVVQEAREKLGKRPN